MAKKTILVIFGGRSVEHEVSVITACQAIKNFDKSRYSTIPVYIDKEGFWWTGFGLKNIDNFKKSDVTKSLGVVKCSLGIVKKGERPFIVLKKGMLTFKKTFDIAFPMIHGTFGEDGTLQGLLEMSGVAYIGCGVFASAVGMDKVAQKIIFQKAGIDVVPFISLFSYKWTENKGALVNEIERKLGYPICVKPANLGSSVGITIVKNRTQLVAAVELAMEFDRKLIVEKALLDMKEINCSVLGLENEIIPSVCEQPVKTEKILSYEDKYIKGGKSKGMASLSRLIPAPIPETLKKKVQAWAIKAFSVIQASGISRIDFMYDNSTKKLYLNEINTLPGSLAFYLWEKSGLSYPKLLDKLVNLGFKRFELFGSLFRTYSENIFRKN